MSISQLATIISLVSGMAVVVSLIFLALQIRQSNRNQKSLMQQGRTTRTVEIMLKMTDRHVGETIEIAHRNCAALNPAQIWCFYGFAGAIFWTYEDSFLQLQANTLDASSWQSDETTLKRLLAFPAYRVVWKMARDGMGPRFREYIDSVVEDVQRGGSESLGDLWAIYAAEEIAAAQRA
jgi:hypothetical protein